MSGIRIHKHKDLLWLIVDRPPLNTLNTELLLHFTSALNNALQQPPRLIVVTGTGEQAFCAGVSLPDDTEAEMTKLLLAAKDADAAFMELHTRSIPTVAIVKGSTF